MSGLLARPETPVSCQTDHVVRQFEGGRSEESAAAHATESAAHASEAAAV